MVVIHVVPTGAITKLQWYCSGLLVCGLLDLPSTCVLGMCTRLEQWVAKEFVI